MKRQFFICHLALVVGLMAFVSTMSSAASGQLNSSAATIAITATLPETLTLSATPAAVAFTLVPGKMNVGTTPVNISTSWVLQGARNSVTLVAYFSSSLAALSDHGSPEHDIGTSMILGQVPTGIPTTYTPFRLSTGFGPSYAGLTLFSQPINYSNFSISRTDTLNLEIDLTSLPQLPAAAYTGTLTLQAQAI